MLRGGGFSPPQTKCQQLQEGVETPQSLVPQPGGEGVGGFKCTPPPQSNFRALSGDEQEGDEQEVVLSEAAILRLMV